MSRHQFGRGLQLLGMLILPFGIVSELMGKVTLGVSGLIALFGMGVFYVGASMQHKR